MTGRLIHEPADRYAVSAFRADLRVIPLSSICPIQPLSTSQVWVYDMTCHSLLIINDDRRAFFNLIGNEPRMNVARSPASFMPISKSRRV